MLSGFAVLGLRDDNVSQTPNCDDLHSATDNRLLQDPFRSALNKAKRTVVMTIRIAVTTMQAIAIHKSIEQPPATTTLDPLP